MSGAGVTVRRRGRQAGVSLVEFALVAPIFVVLLLGLFVACIVVMNQNQLTSAVRDGARAAAVCGGPNRNNQPVMPTLPDGRSACDSSALITYINGTLTAVPGGALTSVCVYVGSGCVATDPGDPNILDKCNKGTVVQIDVSYPQQLYVPVIGNLLGDNGTTIRTLHARAQAVCEQ